MAYYQRIIHRQVQCPLRVNLNNHIHVISGSEQLKVAFPTENDVSPFLYIDRRRFSAAVIIRIE